MMTEPSDSLDVKGWSRYLSELVKSDDETLVAEQFKKFLSVFPNAGDQWSAFARYEMKHSKFDKVEQIFTKSLTKCYHVQLWRVYLEYVQKVNDVITGGESARNTVIASFDFATDHVGIDTNAESLWDDYFSFVNSWNPVSSYEQQQKQELKRKIYHKVIKIPIMNLERFWSDYTAFEVDMNASTGRMKIGENSPHYMEARSWLKEWRNVTAGLNRSLVLNREDLSETSEQLEIWKKWIHWEKLNKMKAAPTVYRKRVEFCYRQSLQILRFVPELWFDFADFNSQLDNTDTMKSIDIIQNGIACNPLSFLLNFQLAEYYEMNNEIEDNLTKLKSVFETLIDKLAEELTKTPNSNLPRAITNVYSVYMKTAKRCLGKKEARAIFAQARKFPEITWHIYVDSAYLEFYSDEPKVATRLFELGFKHFQKEADFLCEYLTFLTLMRDLTNAKTVFETGVKSLSKYLEQKSPSDTLAGLEKLFVKYIKLEYEFGDLKSVKGLEIRFAEIFEKFSEKGCSLNVDIFRKRFIDSKDMFSGINEFDLRYQSAEVSTVRRLSSHEEESEPEVKRQKRDSFSQSEIEDFGASQFAVKDEVYNLLRILPQSQYFNAKTFDIKKLVDLLRKAQQV